MASSGPPRASSRATNGYADEGRPRVPGHSGSFRSERPDAPKKAPSPQPGTQHASTSHKRSASGNPRPGSRTTDERRYEERRVTERTYEAHLQRLVPRTTSPETQQQRRSAQYERRAAEVPKTKAAEPRPRAETPQGRRLPSMVWHCEVTWLTENDSALEPRSHPSSSHFCSSRLANITSATWFDSTPSSTAQTPRRAEP